MIEESKTINGLLIEDDPDDTMLLMELMSQSNWPAFKFIFACAENLEAGLKFMAENDVEVVLLDLMLPDSQGIETLVKVHAQAPDVPIVVLTGLSDEQAGLKALMNGAQDYLVKGTHDGHALKRTISYAVERHRLLVSIKNVIENVPHGAVIVDLKHAIQYMNSAAESILGRKLPQWQGKPFPYPIPANGSGGGKIEDGEGNERIVEMRVSEVRWKDQPARLISISDITDIRRIEQLKAEVLQRQRMEKLKDELIGAVSHEIRSPLTIIKAAASNIKEGLTGPLTEQQSGMIFLQYKNILRLEKIVDNVLDLSRLESGRAQIRSRKVDAVELIRETLRGFRLVAGEQNILIQQEMQRDLPPIYADPDLFVQVLNNLISNALRFAEACVLVRAQVVLLSPSLGQGSEGLGRTQAAQAPLSQARVLKTRKNAGSNVAVSAERKYVQISVIDDGRGIPKDRIGDIFNKFVQIDRVADNEGYKGTGLGLAICKEIVGRQQGRIWAESPEGRGARFHFTLPQYDVAERTMGGGVYETQS